MRIVVLIVAFYYLVNIAQAQDPKAVRKEWAKKLKSTDPLEYKRMVEENTSMKEEAAAKNTTILDLQTQLAQKEEEIKKLNEALKTSNEQHTELKDEHSSYKKSVQTATSKQKNTVDITINNPVTQEKLYKGGVIFKVQVGAFRNKDLTKFFDNNKNFSGDIDDDGVKKYTLGYFNDYWEADNFKKYLREMGVKDAWIVAYKNGHRVNIRDVLEGLL